MDIKAKPLLAISFAALFAASCSSTDGRYTFGQQTAAGPNQGKGVTHTHNGVAHTHPLPEGGLSHTHNYNSGSAVNTCAPCTAGTSRNVVTAPTTTATTAASAGSSGNCHTHQGRRHCHPLPASGTNHTHNQGQGTAATATQPANATYYDYSGGSATGSNYYNYGGAKGNAASNGVTHSHGGKSHTHLLPASGLNHTHTAGSTSIGNTYSEYASGGSATATSGGDANTYIVKPKDTVFQVMRNTGVYWKTIIKLNNLQAPDYTIIPGQRLRLK